jgi:hypothetical protein
VLLSEADQKRIGLTEKDLLVRDDPVGAASRDKSETPADSQKTGAKSGVSETSRSTVTGATSATATGKKKS